MSSTAFSGRNLTYIQLAAGMILFGSATPVSKLVVGGLPPLFASMLRVAIGALVLAPIVVRRLPQLRQLSRGDWLTVLGIALFGMFGFTALMLYGMSRVSGVVGAIVMSTAPAVTAGASMLFFGDRPTVRKIAAIVLAVAGVLVLHLGGTEEKQGSALLLGTVLVFGAVCCEAAYSLLGKRVSEHVDPVLVAFLAALLSIPVFVPFSLLFEQIEGLGTVDPSTWIALAWYGAGTLALGTWFWYSGLRRAEGAIAAGFMGLMPCSALVLSYVLLGESFAWLHLVGFGIVFAGVILMSIEHARMSKDDGGS